MKYKVGKRVLVDISGVSFKGSIVSTETWSEFPYYNVRFDDYYGHSTCAEDSITLLKQHVQSDCDCGVKYVKDGGRHSKWCKLAGLE